MWRGGGVSEPGFGQRALEFPFIIPSPDEFPYRLGGCGQLPRVKRRRVVDGGFKTTVGGVEVGRGFSEAFVFFMFNERRRVGGVSLPLVGSH